jgi:hypothetical protein
LAAALEFLEGGRDILRMPDFECDDFETERAGCRRDACSSASA